ncbi:sugar ABC transporter ATP-binding protein [Diplocloster modestus]|uniref:Ribose/galactose/methyl galactoside import ATP-binding protein n=1 Tax=Diplocloster modestus TaxID=2850322 RepID=A0ABS6KCT7_9FIRM|nr:sugar ABC transporter ATP-binding protein [Diplocloster modestus]MBU9728330.1 sugar ABC transporter ATP-binding protein [Diplocloster modestus]
MLELTGIGKSFPGVRALDQISLTFRPGVVHALMGENGAGKSTLMKIITGIYQPDEGQVCLNGAEVHFKNYRDAVDHEISMVSQEIQVIPEATVAENIVLDRLDKFGRYGVVNWKKVNETAAQYLNMVGLNLDPAQKIGGLTAAQKQLIQIAKALSCNARYILLDEPTSSLTGYEAQTLLDIVRKLKQDQVGVIFISHKIEEVLKSCDKVSVLRDGKFVGTKDCDSVSRSDIVRMMIGRNEDIAHKGFLDVRDEKVLEAKDVTVYGQFDHLNMYLKKGEILGLSGLVGSGRTEFVRLLIGVDKMDEGEVRVNGKKAEIHSLQDALDKYRIGYVTENRKEEGLILYNTVGFNLTIGIWKRLANRFRRINTKEEQRTICDMIRKMEVKTPDEKTKVSSLSGGNQQKISIGKWLAAQCDILIIDEPTVGVDIGAKEYIHDLIWDLADKEHKSIILISSDMPELISLSRRILVFNEQKIVGEINNLNEREWSYADVSEKIGEFLA